MKTRVQLISSNQILLLFVGEGGDPGRVQVVEVAIEDVEAEVAHLRLGDAQRLRDGGRRRRRLIRVVLK